MNNDVQPNSYRVVIVGGGFGGLYAAKALGSSAAQVTLIDRRNFHLFQPLLYQVAMAGLSPGNIAAPLRAILRRHENIRVLLGEVADVDAEAKRVQLADGETISYDALIIATGSTDFYFGNDEWQENAPGLKSLENALDIRARVLRAYEEAERELAPDTRQAWMTFVVVGAGPTGVEMAGALSEMAHHTLKGEFRRIDPADARVLLVEGLPRVLPPYPPELSQRARRSLEKLGVIVRTDRMVTDISDTCVTVRKSGEDDGEREEIQCRTVVWAAGVKASPLGQVLHERTGVELDRGGKVMVEPDLSIAGHPDIFVIGDLAHFAHNDADPLPGIAPVAIQQGGHVGKLLKRRARGAAAPEPFSYFDRGKMATIGRAAAVADIGPLHFGGFFAWLAWLFVHLIYLVGFDNRVLVFIQWWWNYLTYKRGVRLITNVDDPDVEEPQAAQHTS